MTRRPNHGRGGTRHVGRLRIAAAEILTKNLGFTVYPEDVKPQTGSWRTDFRLDVCRWELYAERPASNGRLMPFVAHCWWSLTDFVRECKAAGGVCHFSEETCPDIYPGRP